MIEVTGLVDRGVTNPFRREVASRAGGLLGRRWRPIGTTRPNAAPPTRTGAAFGRVSGGGEI